MFYAGENSARSRGSAIIFCHQSPMAEPCSTSPADLRWLYLLCSVRVAIGIAIGYFVNVYVAARFVSGATYIYFIISVGAGCARHV